MRADSESFSSLARLKWPAKLLSVVHPFNFDDDLDDVLYRVFKLHYPLLELKTGVQGAGESFSFIITKEDENYHHERCNITKTLEMLKLSI